MMCCTMVYFNGPYCTVLCCTAVHCTALYCTDSCRCTTVYCTDSCRCTTVYCTDSCRCTTVNHVLHSAGAMGATAHSNGTGTLALDIGTLASGIGTLVPGIGTLELGIGTLASGIDQRCKKNVQTCGQCLCKKNSMLDKIFAKFYAVLSRK